MTLPCVTRWLAAATALLLVACGGGGGGGGEAGAPLSTEFGAGATADGSGVTFDPPRVQASVPEHGQGRPTPGVRVTAHLSTPPDGPVFVFIEQDQPVFDGELLAPESTADSFSAFLPFSRYLSAGTYAGMVTLRLCGDPACQSWYPGSGAQLPYSVTVTRGIQLTVTVNGQRVDTRPVQTRSGDEVQVVSDMPVQWFKSGSSGGIARNVRETPTTWTATAEYGISTPGSVGDFSLSALTDALGASLLVKVSE